MKYLFLIPPSEGKKSGGDYIGEKLTFKFKKPCNIAVNASERDLKCTGRRYQESLELNKNLCEGKQTKFEKAIYRYSGVMYNSIDYDSMSKEGKDFFNNNFLILSGMYGLLTPQDIIGNYKLPLEKSDLYKFWWEKIPKALINLKPDFIVNLLPINYAKLIGLGTNCSRHKKKLDMLIDSGIKILNINFLKKDGKKISHGVKKIKGQWIKNICEKQILDYQKFGGEAIDSNDTLDINITVL